MHLTLCPLVVGGDAPTLADGAGFDRAECAACACSRPSRSATRCSCTTEAIRKGARAMTITIRRATPDDAAAIARVMAIRASIPA